MSFCPPAALLFFSLTNPHMGGVSTFLVPLDFSKSPEVSTYPIHHCITLRDELMKLENDESRNNHLPPVLSISIAKHYQEQLGIKMQNQIRKCNTYTFELRRDMVGYEHWREKLLKVSELEHNQIFAVPFLPVNRNSPYSLDRVCTVECGDTFRKWFLWFQLRFTSHHYINTAGWTSSIRIKWPSSEWDHESDEVVLLRQTAQAQKTRIDEMMKNLEIATTRLPAGIPVNACLTLFRIALAWLSEERCRRKLPSGTCFSGLNEIRNWSVLETREN